MREILKNVKEKLAGKYLENSNFKGKKKFNIRINYIIAIISILVLGVIFTLLYFWLIKKDERNTKKR